MDKVDQFMAVLVDHGALEPSGMNARGEFTYSMNPEIMLEICPEYYYDAVQSTETAAISLFIDGIVDCDIVNGKYENWRLTELGESHYNDIIDAVSERIEKQYDETD